MFSDVILRPRAEESFVKSLVILRAWPEGSFGRSFAYAQDDRMIV